MMQADAIQILEVRAGEGERPVTITAAVSVDAIRAILTALTEQLDRRRSERAETAADVLVLREHTALIERFDQLAVAAAHAVVALTAGELQTGLLELTAYAHRLDCEGYQPADVRARLAIIAEMTPVLWDANAAAAAAAEPLSRTAY